MKNVMLIVFMLAGVITGKLLAQSHEMGSREKMEEFQSLAGRWKGEGFMQTGPGANKKTLVDETITPKLGGMIMQIEGIGKTADPATGKEAVVHHAFAILSYDQSTSSYKFRSYLIDGRSTEAWFNSLGNRKYQWGFDSPRGKIRYNITIDPNSTTWHEVGEFSSDGNNWNQFFEMKLAKVE